MATYVVMVTGRGLPTRWLVYTDRGADTGHGERILFSKSMVENVLRHWRSRPNCSHLEFTKVKVG